MIFQQLEGFPLRMYIRADRESITRLSDLLYSRFHYDDGYSQESGADSTPTLDNLIFEDENGEFYFPAGLVSIVKDCAEKLGYLVEVNKLEEVSKREDDITVDDNLVNGITLRDYQKECIKYALLYKRGIVQSPTGSGKSSMMFGVCKYLFDNTEGNIVICVPTANLLHQTYEGAEKGVSDQDIFRYGDGYGIEPKKRIMIATVQTLYKRVMSRDEELMEWLENAECLMYDECQHLGSHTWHTVADKLQTEYLLGFSAEPFYNDRANMTRDLLLRGTIGPILYRVSMKDLRDQGYISKPYMIAIESHCNSSIYKVIAWQTVQKTGIVQNDARNLLICQVAEMLISIEKNPLILVQQINHGKCLATQISKNGRRVALMTGGLSVEIYYDGVCVDSYRDEEGLAKRQFEQGRIDALLGTSTLDEGVDMPSLSSVILAGGGKSKLKTIQRIGRGLRKKENDNTTFVIDFTDKFNVVLNKHYKLRKEIMDQNHIPVYSAKTVTDAYNLIQRLRES